MNQSRGRPFEPGNKFGQGRPKGSRNKTTLVAQRLLEEYSEPIVRKCIVDALKGDGPSRRICMERILPAQRDACIGIKLPRAITAKDVDKAAERVLHSVATGRISPASGEAVARILELRRKAIETAELQTRITKLEEQHARAREAQ
jgi:hypothetical protein